MRTPSRQQRIEHFERVHRERGLPLTIQRRAVFDAIVDRDDHPTADQVYEQIRRRVSGLSRATVYRILDKLVELGLIIETCHPGSAARFDAKIHQHHHLVCMACEKIIDVEDERLNHVDWPDVKGLGFQIREYHIHFRGLCADCRGNQKKGGGTAGKTRSLTAKRPTGRKRNQANRKRRTKP